MKISFEQIYNCGEVFEETDLYVHIHYPQMLNRYDSNYIGFRKMPTIEQFSEVEKHLANFHKTNGQQFLKFKFLANEVPPKSLLTELKDYSVGFLELYSISADRFLGNKSKAIVKLVEEEDLATFLALQYKEDSRFGEEFAVNKQALLLRQRLKPGHPQIIAYLDGVACGGVELIETNQTVEIDNLFVVENVRGKGVGSAIQQFVMELAGERQVILVADGEDTARQMYQKQGYSYHGFQYEVLKEGL